MIQSGEDLSFLAEAAQNEVGIHAALHEFDRRALVEFVVGARSFVDRAHAAASDLALDAIRAETPSEHRIFFFNKRLEHAELGIAVERLIQKFARAVVLQEKR